MGCAASNAGQQEVNLVLPLSFERSDAASSCQKKFHEEYDLKGKLGKGAFAQVHLGHKVSDGSVVAVKITDLRGPHKEDKEEVDSRIKRAVDREVVILRRIGVQRYCVNFFEDYAEGLLSYIVMERCDMTLLQALERSSELSENTLVRIFREMLKGMENIHSLGVVHRDIKPDNFLCTGEECTVKLCDFGLAEVLATPTTELKGVYGTAPFMSPEMLAASGYAAATDVWSLGVIAYVLMFGQFPYQPIEATAKAMKAAILAGVPAPTFKPRASLDVGGQCRISADARDFLHATLDRNKLHRPTAAAALAMPWLSETASEEQWSMPSLRPMLYAAKRVGAFDTRGNNPNDKGSSVDHLLAGLQAKNSGGSGVVSARHSVNSVHSALTGRGRTDKTHPKCSSEVSLPKAGHRHDKLDPTMVQSGGMLSNTSHISTATGTSTTSYQSNPSKPGQRSMLTSREA